MFPLTPSLLSLAVVAISGREGGRRALLLHGGREALMLIALPLLSLALHIPKPRAASPSCITPRSKRQHHGIREEALSLCF